MQSEAFPDVVPMERPLVELPTTIDPEWLAGFTSAEGSFMIFIYKSKTRVGYAVKLVFSITQHSRDSDLMKMLIIYLECGYIIKDRDCSKFIVTKSQDIQNKIIPFFSAKKHPRSYADGVKGEDFDAWCRAAKLKEDKKHLTLEGLEEISKIKAGMNQARKWVSDSLG